MRFAVSYITKVFLVVASILTLSLGAMFGFMYSREQQFRKEMLNAQLSLLNHQLLDHYDGGIINVQVWERGLDLPFQRLRFSIFDSEGNILYDNKGVEDEDVTDVLALPSVVMANESDDHVGYNVTEVDDGGKDDAPDYYYYATLKEGDLYARTGALGYELELADILQIDKKLVWYAILIYLLVLLVTYLSINKVGKIVRRLSNFAQKAERGEEIYDIEAFPNDEMGKIARNIVLLYVRLQRTMADRDLQAQIALREEQDKATLKKNLTNNINHELKTPISAISLELETLIANKDRLTDAQRDMLIKRCKANSERLLRMVQDILTLNRLDDGSDAIRSEILSLTDVVEEVTDNLAVKAHDAGIEFDVRLPDVMMMKGNSPLLDSIFSNLINNAILYSGADKISIFLQEEDADSYRIIICDNGSGIPEEHLDHIFDRFYRVESGRSRKKGGTGIGLAIVKSAAQFHNGDITIRNLPSGGLEFTLTLAKNLPKDSENEA
ncbi:MAG: HAMP domain-containing histidine kinase [Muribaculum sp.]|nr:HAMP domain-containing histidine kinase [Muribaculum sp.]